MDMDDTDSLNYIAERCGFLFLVLPFAHSAKTAIGTKDHITEGLIRSNMSNAANRRYKFFLIKIF